MSFFVLHSTSVYTQEQQKHSSKSNGGNIFTGTLVNKQYCFRLCMYGKDSSRTQEVMIEITKSFTGATFY